MIHIKGGLIMRGRKRKPSVLDGHKDFITTHTRREIMKEFGVSYNYVNNYCIKYSPIQMIIFAIYNHLLTDFITNNKI